MFDKKRLRKIKLIVADLDGTLLTNEGRISSKTNQLIRELRKNGVLFSFASGRLHSALVPFAKDLGIQLPLISLDGCLIKDCNGGEILFESNVPVKYVQKALRFADKFLLNVALSHADAIYYTEGHSLIPQLMEKFGAKYEEVSEYNSFLDKTLEISFVSDFKDNIKYVQDRLSFPYSFGLDTSYFKSHTHKGIYYLEVRKRGTNKGKALRILMRKLGIKEKETAVIGDWHNDISLFLPNTLKVTLSNSLPELKRMADIEILKDNNEDGVAEFLEVVLKSKVK